MFVVYTEIHENGEIERWYYDTFESRAEANRVAYELGGQYPIFHCVMDYESAKECVLNMP